MADEHFSTGPKDTLKVCVKHWTNQFLPNHSLSNKIAPSSSKADIS
jgi:hypothetical protein